MRPPIDPHREIFTVELLETITTADEPFTDLDGSWGTRVARPPGHGWRVADYSHDKRTTWTRRRSVIWPPRKASRGGGGWRR
jgi:hypothetical protein